VRYLGEEGELTDYEPELREIEEGEKSIHGESLTGYAYENKSGDKKHYLPQSLTEETPVILEYGKYKISIAMAAKTVKNILGETPVKASKEQGECARISDRMVR
jgi:hypothetical protein